MTSFSLKSLLLGIGIGIIVTAIAGLIYFAGWDPLKNLTEKDIVQLETRYGLVRSSNITTSE